MGWSPQSLEHGLAGWQRLTFSPDKKLVPFTPDLVPVAPETPREQWPEEVTGQIRFDQFATYVERPSPHDATRMERVKSGYDLDAVEAAAVYQCAHCQRDIAFIQLGWMLARYRWMAHNPAAPRDRISAHVWMGYSPAALGGGWGLIAKEFLEARRDLAALVTFHQMTKGEPFIRQGSAVKGEDLDRVIARTPVRYVKGQLPREAEFLSMTIDKQSPDQGQEFWYSIRAWGVMWEHPEQPTWTALVDWGRAYSWEELLELAGLRASESGHERRFHFRRADGTTREYQVSFGLVDSGHGAESVYEFCLKLGTVFDPYKGVGQQHTRGLRVRMSKVLEEQVDLWLCWSDFFAENLYYDCLKWGVSHGEPIHWWLPVDIDDDYRKQLTDEYKDSEGSWVTRTKTNHLGDTEKMHRAMAGKIEDVLQQIRDDREKEHAIQHDGL